jgi:hypothetical protein
MDENRAPGSAALACRAKRHSCSDCSLAWEAVVLQTRPMSYEEMVAELRNLVGERIAVSMALQQFGPADGYLADFSGRVEPIDDPIPGVDFPVHYVRVGERGFGIPRAMFDRAEWVTTAGQRELEIGVGDVRVGITKCDASDERRKTGSRRSAAFGVPHPVLDSRRPPVSSPCGRPYGRHPRHFTCHAPKSAQGISARHGVHPWQSQARPAIFGTRSAGLGSVAISSATSEATRPSPGSVSRRSISSAST